MAPHPFNIMKPNRNTTLMNYHFRAVELRYEGKKYEDIAIEISPMAGRDMKHQTVRHWFISGGILEALYIDYATKENDRRRQMMRTELGKLVPHIAPKFEALLTRQDIDQLTLRTLVELMKTLGMMQEQNSNDILDDYFDRVEGEIKDEQSHATQGDTNEIDPEVAPS